MLLSPPPRPRALDPEPEREPRASLGSEALVWLVRHGRVTARDIAYGDDDVPLSSDGKTQTDAVAESFRNVEVTFVATSPLQRARAMGEAVGRACGVSIEVDPRLAELQRGDWQGLTRTEYAARWARESDAYWRAPLTWRGHGGESEAQLVERAWPALEAAVRGADGGVAVLTAHRQVIRALVAAAIGVPVGISHAVALDPAHGILLRDAASGWILERTNAARPGAPHMAETEDGPPEDVVTQMR